MIPDDKTTLEKIQEKFTFLMSEGFIQADARQVASLLLKVARYRKRHQKVDPRNPPKIHPLSPQGPFARPEGSRICDLLVFVPRDLKSRLVDDATGGYGYSHVAVDCGEADLPSGKRVMVESTPFNPVHRSFLDTYGKRPFVRIPLSEAGVDCDQFNGCVLSKLGDKYDDLEALTWGEVDDPARQICSDLAAACMPAGLKADIAQKRQAGLLRRTSVSVHGQRRGDWKVFISPNGFSEYFGAPRGEDIHLPDHLMHPSPLVDRVHQPQWAGIAGRLVGVLLGGLLLGGLLVSWRAYKRGQSG